MKRFLWIPLLFLVCCSTNANKDYNSKLVARYENVYFSTLVESGNIYVCTSDLSKEWTIKENNISFVYERQIRQDINNYFYEYTNYYRILVYIRHLGD